ncbi:MAG: hypothetical protein JO137_19785 [Hyphomicrobiales bacterium]|nr:hypothetical protein [Hyphomicrobiales bacterium]MBV9434071.1 hypothetical protein [Hyphomicrobiales bacterium]
MGREALVHAEVGGENGEVRALLESGDLILRGAIRRRYSRSALTSVAVEKEALRFTCAAEVVRLFLGSRKAESWCKAITTPPPSLRAKLGLQNGARAVLIGSFNDGALAAALDGVLVEDGAADAMMIACIEGPNDLSAAQAMHAAHPSLALWAIYPKGRGVSFGEREIRDALRAKGLRDNKSCAVSERLTATRFNLAQE